MSRRFYSIPIILICIFFFSQRGRTECLAGESPPEVHSRPAAAADSAGYLIDMVPRGGYLGKGLLREPLGVSVDPRGVVYVADPMAGKVFRFSEEGGATEFESPSAMGSVYPIDLAGSGAFVFVLDYSSGRILRYDYRGAYLDVLVSFSEYGGVKPASMNLEGDGRFLVTDIENHSVTILNPLLDIEIQIGEYGWSEGYFDRPMKAVILPGGRVAVADMGNRRVQIFSPSGAYLDTLDTGGERFCAPRSLSSDSYGNLFVADTECGVIRVFSENGRETVRIGSYMGNKISPSDLSAGLDDYLYVSDLESRSVIIYQLVYPDIRQ